jgi:hypothetical protein
VFVGVEADESLHVRQPIFTTPAPDDFVCQVLDALELNALIVSVQPRVTPTFGYKEYNILTIPAEIFHRRQYRFAAAAAKNLSSRAQRSSPRRTWWATYFCTNVLLPLVACVMWVLDVPRQGSTVARYRATTRRVSGLTPAPASWSRARQKPSRMRSGHRVGRHLRHRLSPTDAERYSPPLAGSLALSLV